MNQLDRILRGYKIALMPFIYLLFLLFRNMDMSNSFPYVFIWVISFPLLLIYIFEGKFLAIFTHILNKKAFVGNAIIVLTLFCAAYFSSKRVLLSNYEMVWIPYFLSPYPMFFNALMLYSFDSDCFIRAVRLLNIFVLFTAFFGVAEQVYYLAILRDNSHRITSVYINTFMHGTVCLFAIFFPGISKNRRINVLVRCLYIYNSFFTFSRNLWMSLIFVAIIQAFTFKKKIKLFLARLLSNKRAIVLTIVVTVLAVVFFISTGIMSSILVRFDLSKAGTSYTVRTVYPRYFFSNLYQNFSKREILFGCGTKSSRVAIEASGIMIGDYAAFDNMYLTTLYEYGILGILFIITIISRAFRLRRWTINEERMNGYSLPYNFAMLTISAIIPAAFYEIYDWHSVILILVLGWAVITVEFNRRVAQPLKG